MIAKNVSKSLCKSFFSNKKNIFEEHFKLKSIETVVYSSENRQHSFMLSWWCFLCRFFHVEAKQKFVWTKFSLYIIYMSWWPAKPTTYNCSGNDRHWWICICKWPLQKVPSRAFIASASQQCHLSEMCRIRVPVCWNSRALLANWYVAVLLLCLLLFVW